MTTTTIYWNFDVAGIPTDPTSVVFSDPTGTFGVRRTDTLAVVVPDGTALTHDAVGVYHYTITDPAYNLTYNYWIEFVYSGNTFRIEQEISGSTGAAPAADTTLEEDVVTAGCGGSYAYAWEFASFWCAAGLLKRKDNGGSNDRASLSDSQTDFISSGVEANVGMILYNLTDGSNGVVTAVTQHTVMASLAGGSDNHWDDGDVYRIVTLDAHEIAAIAQALSIAAGDIHAALAATGACACTFSSWGRGLLKKINIIEAGAFYQCPCARPNVSDDMRNNLLTWATSQLDALRKGDLDVCSGATGTAFPSIDWGEQAVNEFAAAQIIENAGLSE